MSTLRRTILFVMMAVMAAGLCFAVPEPAAAAAKTVVFTNADSNLVVAPGKKYTLRCKAPGSVSKSSIRYRSSNTKIATVSRKGVVTAKRKGKATITAYVLKNGKKKYSASFKLRVGPRVTKITIKADTVLRSGSTKTFKATVSPSSAANPKVSWRSSDPEIAEVSSGGKVTGISEGTAKITASALDGSKKKRTVTVQVYDFHRGDTLWIAHRGLRTGTLENTAEAFAQAGETGFWGCECDILETKHQDGEFELVISHDETFERVFGVDKKVSEMTADEIRNYPGLKGKVCFFDEYLDICWQYGMVPVVELKDENISHEAMVMAAEMVYEAGLRNGGDAKAGAAFLKTTDWTGFYAEPLKEMADVITASYGIDPLCTYIFSKKTEDEAMDEIQMAASYGFDGVSVSRSILYDSIPGACAQAGLDLDVWAFADTMAQNDQLYSIISQENSGVSHLTVDYLPYTD